MEHKEAQHKATRTGDAPVYRAQARPVDAEPHRAHACLPASAHLGTIFHPRIRQLSLAHVRMGALPVFLLSKGRRL